MSACQFHLALYMNNDKQKPRYDLDNVMIFIYGQNFYDK